MMAEVLERKCVVCGGALQITVNKDKTYSGGHYFDFKDLGGEYWECDDCYKEWPK